MSIRPRLIAVSVAGLLTLSLAPAAIGQASSPAVSAAPQEWASAAAASPASDTRGLVSPASALTFTNRTTANGLGSDYVYAVYVTDDTVYAATLNRGGAALGGLSISDDGGASFANRLSGTSVLAVYVEDDTVYAATEVGLSISTDGGASFNTPRTRSNSGLADDVINGVYAAGSKVYAATSSGLSISTDGGANFITRLVPPNFRVWSVYAIDDTVYAGTDNRGLRISSDGGVTFPVDRRIADGLAADNVRSVYAAGSTVYAAGTADFFTSGTGGVSISTNGGATFTYDDSRSGLGTDDVYSVYESGGVIYAGTRGGVSVSNDGGATYTNYSTSNSAIGSNEVIGVFARGGIAYAATDSGLSISGPSLPALNASPSSSSVAVGAADTVTISSAALAIPDGTSISAVSANPGVATVTSTANSSGGSASFTVTGVSAGTSNVTFSATGYANVVVPVTVAAPGPTPPATSPPSAPLNVIGFPGDSQVEVSWSTPASPGSFPITNYEVTSNPGGLGCLATVLSTSCMINGLTDGTPYVFTVRALNGAGWGLPSVASAAVTPSPATLVISGTRSDVRGKPGVVVSGTSTGLANGTIVRPWVRFPGQTSYTDGVASILVDEAGDFTWQRRTGKKVYVYVKTEDGTARSNRVVIAALR